MCWIRIIQLTFSFRSCVQLLLYKLISINGHFGRATFEIIRRLCIESEPERHKERKKRCLITMVNKDTKAPTKKNLNGQQLHTVSSIRKRCRKKNEKKLQRGKRRRKKIVDQTKYLVRECFTVVSMLEQKKIFHARSLTNFH